MLFVVPGGAPRGLSPRMLEGACDGAAAELPRRARGAGGLTFAMGLAGT